MTYMRDLKTGEVIKVLEVRMFEPRGADPVEYHVEFLKDDKPLLRVRKSELLKTLGAWAK